MRNLIETVEGIRFNDVDCITKPCCPQEAEHTYLPIKRVFDFILAAFFLIISSPILLIIGVLIKLHDGNAILYRGSRLGLNKKPFIMYKFRTLEPEAEQIIGADLLSHKHKLVTRLGFILRESRLDELPQLFNILKGDMSFIGPRPERPVIYKKVCRHIKFYDKRFSVAPGLIGFSQLFTPHSSPKKIRAMIDNHFINSKLSMLMELKLILYALLMVLLKSLQKLAKAIWGVRGWVLDKNEKRALERVRLKNTDIAVVRQYGMGEKAKILLEDINEEAFMVSSDGVLDFEKGLFRLETDKKIFGSTTAKKKSAYCNAVLYKTILKNKGYGYVFKYSPVSQLNDYMLHQYFLSKSIG